MGTVANLAVKLTANATEFEQAMGSLQTDLGTVGSTLTSIGNDAALSLSTGFTPAIMDMAARAAEAGIPMEDLALQYEQIQEKAIRAGISNTDLAAAYAHVDE